MHPAHPHPSCRGLPFPALGPPKTSCGQLGSSCLKQTHPQQSFLRALHSRGSAGRGISAGKGGAPHPAPPACTQHLRGGGGYPCNEGVSTPPSAPTTALRCRVNPPHRSHGMDGKGRMGPGSVLWVLGLSLLLCLLTNRIPRGELTQPSPSSPQPGVSQLHIPFPGKWDLYISHWIQATIIMVGFGGGYLRSEAAFKGGLGGSSRWKHRGGC